MIAAIAAALVCGVVTFCICWFGDRQYQATRREQRQSDLRIKRNVERLIR